MTPPLSWNEINEWIRRSRKLLIKKLARNDCSWADDPKKHQYGSYMPKEIRSSDFFPKLQNTNPAKPHIYEVQINTIWPATAEVKQSNLKHYSNKGSELHFTGVPKEMFSGLAPASLLLGGLLRRPLGETHYWFITIDSLSDEAAQLESAFDLGADFHYGLFDPGSIFSTALDNSDLLIQEIGEAIKSGTLKAFIKAASHFPQPSTLAAEAQKAFLLKHGRDSLNPYEIHNPGDAVMEISRDIEYSLYRRLELRRRAAEAIGIITKGDADIVSAVVKGYPELNAIFLSASQTRKSRAGRSFEHHVARLLRDGQVLFQEQAVTGGSRPDFVMPNVIVLKQTVRTYDDALVLSLKTTLRERWKQVPMEKLNCALFLATVDDRVSSDAIESMCELGVHLLVPESLKKSKETCYGNKPNVITFRDFFDEEIHSKRPQFLSAMPASGFGMLTSHKRAVPEDFDPAELLKK